MLILNIKWNLSNEEIGDIGLVDEKVSLKIQ
jgi:hypothetical protein